MLVFYTYVYIILFGNNIRVFLYMHDIFHGYDCGHRFTDPLYIAGQCSLYFHNSSIIFSLLMEFNFIAYFNC